MTFDVGAALAWGVLVLLFLAGCWVIIPHMHGMAGVPARPRLIRRALEMAGVQPGEVVYDLGAGDGRALIIAAREFGARAVGLEVEPVHCAVAWLRALVGGLLADISVRRQNFFHADLREADVVFLYLTPPLVERLRSQLELQLRPGARVVSLSFPFEGWRPSDIDIGHLIFLYHMPPVPGNLEAFLRESLSRCPC